MADNYYPIEFNTSGDSFTIINSGTAPAPCIITIIPRIDFVYLSIQGLTELPISVSGLTAGDVLVINGEERKVFINEVEAFNRYNAWEFPKLKPGVNEI